MKISRNIKSSIVEDLKEKMVFIGGPRQVGKTTFSLQLLSEDDRAPATISHPAYINWDKVADRQSLIKGELPPNQPLIIFDEIHKYKHWKN